MKKEKDFSIVRRQKVEQYNAIEGVTVQTFIIGYGILINKTCELVSDIENTRIYTDVSGKNIIIKTLEFPTIVNGEKVTQEQIDLFVDMVNERFKVFEPTFYIGRKENTIEVMYQFNMDTVAEKYEKWITKLMRKNNIDV